MSKYLVRMYEKSDVTYYAVQDDEEMRLLQKEIAAEDSIFPEERIEYTRMPQQWSSLKGSAVQTA